MKRKKEDNINVIEEKSLKKSKANKERLGSKFLKVIKQRWLIKGTTTLLLIAILIAAFVLINIGVKKLNITAIDCTENKTYTLTDESKERVKDIDKDVNIYFVAYEESDPPYTLAKQYSNANSKIKVKMVDATTDLDFAKKYDVTGEDATIIVANGDVTRTLSSYDLYSYDADYNTIDLTEQKLTSAILNVVSQDIPKAYFLSEYTSLSFSNGLQLLSQYLEDEVLDYETLNILSTGKIPEDCDVLVIMTPEKDFDDITTKAIKDYIKSGRNILWLNSAVVNKSSEFKNVNKILSQYGVKEFEKGIIYETNQENTILGYPIYFMPQVQNTEVTEDISAGSGVAFIQATKINFDTDKFEKLNVEKTDLILTSDTTYFTTDLSGAMNTKTDEKGAFTVGAQLVKTISEADEDSEEDDITSTLIIYGDNLFASDTTVSYGNYGAYAINLANNADLVLNSIGFLSEKDENITIRKNYTSSSTTFTPTDGEISIIVKIIFVVPVAIIALGVIIWIIRKNKK